VTVVAKKPERKLVAGDEVVIDGHQKVRPGVVVNPHRTTDKPAAATR
jgi:hypothetical protein